MVVSSDGPRREEPITEDLDLVEAAAQVRHHAYARYSGFRVGAALRTERGGVFLGCNVENASYGLTICAERAAVLAAIAAEGESMRIAAIAVAAVAVSCPPCGACLQVLAEFGNQARIIFTSDGRLTVTRLHELLPFRFRLADR
jgi:cytidine deaminase